MSYLSINTISKRRKTKIAIGHNDNFEMLRAMRAHSNFAEYVPITLFAIFLAESLGANSFFIHALGSSLLIGRILHAYGISKSTEDFRFRITGMSLTFTSMISSSFYLAYRFYSN